MEYTDPATFTSIANRLGIMSDFKAGVPRTAYMGVVTLWWKGTRVFVVPSASRRSLPKGGGARPPQVEELWLRYLEGV